MSLYARAAFVVTLVLAVLAGVWKVRVEGVMTGRAEVQQKWDSAKVVQTQLLADAQDAARRREHALAATLETLRQESRRATETIDARYRAELERLRQRPERAPPAGPGDVPAAAAACPGGATGAQLARGDAEFLSRYAADAARLQVAVAQCEAAYAKARGALEPPK